MPRGLRRSYLPLTLGIGALAVAAAQPVQADVFDFIQTGGPGSTHGGHIYVEVTENLLTPANDALFTFTNALPVLNPNLVPSISYVWFDTGSHGDLFTGLSVVGGTVGGPYSGVNLVPITPANTHPFLPASFAPDYKFGLSTVYPYDRPIWGVNPGEYLTISAALGGGKTFSDVVAALNQGIDPNRSTQGLRVGALVYFLDGTQQDDGGFVTNSTVPVPEPDTWAMLLAGIGGVGLAMRRRRS